MFHRPGEMDTKTFYFWHILRRVERPSLRACKGLACALHMRIPPLQERRCCAVLLQDRLTSAIRKVLGSLRGNGLRDRRQASTFVKIAPVLFQYFDDLGLSGY